MAKNATTSTAVDILASAGATISIPEYAKVTGISRETAYGLAARDELDVRVLRFGRKIRIPTADVRRQLGLDVVA